MKYILFDSDIWLNLLKESANEDNKLIPIKFWLKYGHITILLPEIIEIEWKRNIDNKRNTLINDWKTFFNRAKNVFSKNAIQELNTPEFIEKKVKEQLEIIEDIFTNYSIKIPITNEIKLKAISLAEEKKAPFGKYNSIGDAYILLSTINYIEKNKITDSYFITNNYTDFSDKNDTNKVHPDIEHYFKNLKIHYYSKINLFFHDIINELPNYIEYIKLEEIEKEQAKFNKSLNNPESAIKFDTVEDIYLENIKHIDIIVNSNKPTKHQILFIFGLIESDRQYHNYFFSKLDNPKWFDILNIKNYFSAKNNPSPIKLENGYSIPYWPVLQYLERLSINANEEIAEKLLTIIKDVSNNPKDNFHTWHSFIKIICNLPKNYISIDILDYLETWLNSDFETDLQSSEICKSLLPKFLNEKSDKDDLIKAEKILTILFDVQAKKYNDSFSGISDVGRTYKSYVNLYWLKEALVNKNMIEQAAKKCSENLIYKLCDSIKMILLDYPSGKRIGIKNNGSENLLRIKYIGNDVALELYSEKNEIISKSKIEKYETISDKKLNKEINEFLKKCQIHKEIEKHAESIKSEIFNDLSNIWIYSLHQLKNEYRDGDGLFKTFTLILIELIDLRIKENPNDIRILKNLLLNYKYRLPFFKRIVLYIVSNNWDSTKSVFWEMIKNKDEIGYFSLSVYRREIYYLLQLNISLFSDKERNLINDIIEQGPQKELPENKEGYKDYWKYEWYSALRGNAAYSEKYNEFSKKFNTTGEKEFENEGMIFSRWGDVSPYSKEEIIKMPVTELVQNIVSFNPKSGFDDPSIEGFSDTLKNAVKDNPDHFTENMECFIGIPFIYIYRILHGLRDAWKNKKDFDWKQVLIFCLKYIEDNKFDTDELIIKNDIWKANKKWVIGSIADLIADGTRSDDHAFDISLLPIAKKILLNLAKYLQPDNEYKETNMDFPTYTLNSTNGNVIHALVDYSLRYARNHFKKDDIEKWDSGIKEIFKELNEKKIFDLYILKGWYFNQFYYIDKNWVEQYSKDFYCLESDYWYAFICSYGFANPMFRKDIYEIMKPHFKRFVNEKREDKRITRHLSIYYIWDYESLDKESLFKRFLDYAGEDSISEIIYFLGGEVKYFKEIKDKEKKERSFNKIISLWEYILVNETVYKNKENIKLKLLQFIGFIEKLDDKYTELIIKSFNWLNKPFDGYKFVKELLRFTESKDTKVSAKYIGEIYKSSLENGRYPEYADPEIIKIIVIFLYENDQKEIADFICNKYAEMSYYFLRDIYNKYNNGKIT